MASAVSSNRWSLRCWRHLAVCGGVYKAGIAVQVIMDVLGVAITCATCHFVLDQLVHGL